MVKDHGIFVETIPYKDNRFSKEEKMFNLIAELDQIRTIVSTIKKALSYEKIDAFIDIDLDRMNFSEFSNEQIDQISF